MSPTGTVIVLASNWAERQNGWRKLLLGRRHRGDIEGGYCGADIFFCVFFVDSFELLGRWRKKRSPITRQDSISRTLRTMVAISHPSNPPSNTWHYQTGECVKLSFMNNQIVETFQHRTWDLITVFDQEQRTQVIHVIRRTIETGHSSYCSPWLTLSAHLLSMNQ